MPLYELFCLSKAQLSKVQLSEVIKLAGRIVLNHGGVITDVKSFGEQQLAYEIRRPGEKHHAVRSFSEKNACNCSQCDIRMYDHLLPTLVLQAAMWQLTFLVKPSILSEIDHALRVDDRVIRWNILKRRELPPLPNPYRVARAAESVALSEK